MEEQLEKIDNVLITASTALLAAFVVLFTAESPENIFLVPQQSLQWYF